PSAPESATPIPNFSAPFPSPATPIPTPPSHPGLSCRDRQAHRLALRKQAPREEIAMRKVFFVRMSKLLWTVATVLLVVAAGAYVGWRLSDGSSKPASASAPRV